MPDINTIHFDSRAVNTLSSGLWRKVLGFLSDPAVILDRADRVAFCNSDFERVFEWRLGDIKGKPLDFVPPSQEKATNSMLRKLLQEKVLHGFRTWRLNKSAKRVDVVMDALLLFGADQSPAGMVMTLRDITRKRRTERGRRLLVRIIDALYRFEHLDALLDAVSRMTRVLMRVEGVAVILADAQADEFFFQAASFADPAVAGRLKSLRFPIDRGVAGHVYHTGKPLMVDDDVHSPHRLKMVDDQWLFEARNVLSVPLRRRDRIIGVLFLVNKRDGLFDFQDVETVCAVAGLVALPVENAGINAALGKAFEPVGPLDHCWGHMIHQLSHELKTPLAVLSASIRLLEKGASCQNDPKWQRIHERIERNLQRLLDLEYKLEDILHDGNGILPCQVKGEEKL